MAIYEAAGWQVQVNGRGLEFFVFLKVDTCFEYSLAGGSGEVTAQALRKFACK